MTKIMMFYVVLGGLVGTAAVISQGVDLFPDCRGKEYARPTCGGEGPSGEYFSGSTP